MTSRQNVHNSCGLTLTMLDRQPHCSRNSQCFSVDWTVP